MPGIARLTLRGFGRTNSVTVPAVRPEREHALVAAVRDGAPDGVLAHGGGGSYGGCAPVQGGAARLTRAGGRPPRLRPAPRGGGGEAGVTTGGGPRWRW